MNTRQIQLVQTSFRAQVAPLGAAAARSFYANLFALDPSLRALFADDLAAQQHALLRTLSVVVEHLDAPDTIVETVRQLGARHRGYGVRVEHYDTVGRALLQTLHGALGADFTPEVREAWTAAYVLLASLMQAGAAVAA